MLRFQEVSVRPGFAPKSDRCVAIAMATVIVVVTVVSLPGCSGASPYQPTYSVGGGKQGASGNSLPGDNSLPDGSLPDNGSAGGGDDDLQGSASYAGGGSLAVADGLGDSLNNYPVANSNLSAVVRSAVFTLNSAGASLGGSPRDEVRNAFQGVNRQSGYNIAKSATWPAGDVNYSNHSYLVFAKSFTSGGVTYVGDKPFPVFPTKQASARDFGPLATGGRAAYVVTFNNGITADYVVTRAINGDLPGCQPGVFAPVTSRLSDTTNTIGIRIAVSLRGAQDNYNRFPATSMVFVNDFRNGGQIPAIGTCSPSWNEKKKNLAWLSLMYSLVSSQ